MHDLYISTPEVAVKHAHFHIPHVALPVGCGFNDTLLKHMYSIRRMFAYHLDL